MDHLVTVRAERNKILHRIEYVTSTHMRDRDPVVYFNKTFSKRSIEPSEIETASFAGGTMCCNSSGPVGGTTFISIYRNAR